MKQPSPRRLFFDIETSPNIGLFWEAGYKKDIPYDNIIKERAIICICYKWQDEKKVHSITWDDNQDDKSMIKSFIEIANDANELVGHNGDGFDLPWIRTRCLYHGIPMFPTYSTLDTLKKARYYFKFNSNTLNYIGGYLGVGNKKSTGYDLWKKIVLEKDNKALKYMVEYCKQDVLLLEKVYKKLSNYISANVHHGVIHNQNRCSCPECSSTNTHPSKYRMTSIGTMKVQLKCHDCGKYHTVAESTYNKCKHK